MDNPKRTYYQNGNVKSEEWMINGHRNRINGAAYITYHINGNRHFEGWWENDQCHKLDGPAAIYYWDDGNIQSVIWFLAGKIIEDAPYDCWPLTKEQQIELKLMHG